jgi:hypothetical protein
VYECIYIMTGALPPSAAPIAQARATYNTSNPRTADTRTHVHYIIYAYMIRIYTYFYFTVILLIRFYRRVTRLVIIIITCLIGIRVCDFYNCQVSWKYFNGHNMRFCIECQLLRRPCIVNHKDLVYNLNEYTINQNINKTENTK